MGMKKIAVVGNLFGQYYIVGEESSRTNVQSAIKITSFEPDKEKFEHSKAQLIKELLKHRN